VAFVYKAGSSGTAAGSGTSAAISGLTAPSAGDLVVFYLNSNSDTATAESGPDSDSGAAWTTELVEQPTGETGRHGLAWKIANGFEPTSYSWTTGSAEWRVIVKTFSSDIPAVVDAACNSADYDTGNLELQCAAYNGQVISDNAVAVAFAGKDNRGGQVTYSTANNSYTGVLGSSAAGTNDQVTGGSHRIYTTGETGSGNVTLDVGGNDGVLDTTFSMHMSWVEGAAPQTTELTPAILRKPFDRRSTAKSRIDYTNPLTRGMVFCLPLNEGVGHIKDLVNNITLDDGAMPNRSPPGLLGPSVWSNGQSIASGARVPKRDPTKGLTMFALPTYKGASGTTVAIEWYDTGDSKGYRIETDTWDTFSAIIKLTQHWWGDSLSTGEYLVPKQPLPIPIVATVDPSGNAELFVYGRSEVSGTLTEDLTPGGNNHAVSMLDVSGNDNTSYHYLSVVWERVLSNSEIASMSANPWQIFEPSKIFVPTKPKEQRLVVF
jgi:hypothetical protein